MQLRLASTPLPVPTILGLAVLAGLLVPNEARAQDTFDAAEPAPSPRSSERRGFGVGVETFLLGAQLSPGGAAAFTFEPGPFRIDGLLGLYFEDNDQTSFAVGGRFLYIVHEGRHADFSAGAGLGITHNDTPGPGEFTLVHLEGVAQLRIFLADNACINASLGLGVAVGDDTRLSLGGLLGGALGLRYFF